MYRCIKKGQELLVFDRAGNPVFKRPDEPRRVMDYQTNKWIELPQDAELNCVDYNAKPSICAQFNAQECNAFSDLCQSYNLGGQRRCRRRGNTLKSLSALEKCYQEKENLLQEIAKLRLAQASMGDNPDLFMDNDVQKVALLEAQIKTLQQEVAELNQERVELLEELRRKPAETRAQAENMPALERAALLAQLEGEKNDLKAALALVQKERDRALADLDAVVLARDDAEERLRLTQLDYKDNRELLQEVQDNNQKIEQTYNNLLQQANQLQADVEKLEKDLKSAEKKAEEAFALYQVKDFEYNKLNAKMQEGLRQYRDLELLKDEILRQKEIQDAKFAEEISNLKAKLAEKELLLSDPNYQPAESPYQTFQERFEQSALKNVSLQAEIAKLKEKIGKLESEQEGDTSTFKDAMEELQENIGNLKQKLQKRDNDLEALRTELSDRQAQIIALNSRIAEFDSIMETKNAALVAAQNQLKQTQTRLQETEEQMASIQRDLLAAQSQVQQQEANIETIKKAFAQVLGKVRENMSDEEFQKFFNEVTASDNEPPPYASTEASTVRSTERSAGMSPRRKSKMIRDVEYVLDLLAEASYIIAQAHAPSGRRRRYSGRAGSRR